MKAHAGELLAPAVNWAAEREREVPDIIRDLSAPDQAALLDGARDSADTVRGLFCACSARIVGRGFVEAIGATPLDGPRLCRSCAADHARERPDGIAPAGALADGIEVSA